MMKRGNDGAPGRGAGFLVGVFASGSLGCALTLAAVLGPSRLPEFAAGLAFDALCLLAFWLTAELLRRAPSAIAWVRYFVVLAALFAIGLVYAHAWFFDVAIERRLTLLDMTLAGISHFFSTSLPPHGLTLLVALLTAVLALGVAGERWWRPRLSRRLLFALLALLTLALPLVLRASRIASPLYDSAKELYELATLPRVRPEGEVDRRLLRSLAKLDRTQAPSASAFSKVIVLVMETMTAEKLERERRSLDARSFFRRERAHLFDYTQYFPNNQDSRTGMLNMLFARVIPYEAYSEYGVEHYRGIARTPSLVDRMREGSYRTAFAVSQTTLEEVVADLRWDETLRLDTAKIEAARREKKLCFTPDEYEQSCEDLALLPQVVDFVVRHPRAFVYQEFIWGHAAEYNEASGKSNTQYYSEYVDALLAALARAGLAQQTLLAITSDHGFRDKGRQHDAAAYRIPLAFHAPRFEAHSDAQLLSHVDFAMLLFEAMRGQAPRSERNSLVTIVGPTGQGHLYTINEQGGSVLLREKLGWTLKVSQSGAFFDSPARILATFETYRTAFDRELASIP